LRPTSVSRWDQPYEWPIITDKARQGYWAYCLKSRPPLSQEGLRYFKAFASRTDAGGARPAKWVAVAGESRYETKLGFSVR
jgi:hypothetical protein